MTSAIGRPSPAARSARACSTPAISSGVSGGSVGSGTRHSATRSCTSTLILSPPRHAESSHRLLATARVTSRPRRTSAASPLWSARRFQKRPSHQNRRAGSRGRSPRKAPPALPAKEAPGSPDRGQRRLAKRLQTIALEFKCYSTPARRARAEIHTGYGGLLSRQGDRLRLPDAERRVHRPARPEDGPKKKLRKNLTTR